MPVVHTSVFNTATDGLDFAADAQTFTIASGITVASEQADGVFSNKFQSTLINYGLVESDAQIGVFMTGDNAVVQNGAGAAIVGSKGVVMEGASAHVVNAGTITGFSGSGVAFNPTSTNTELHNSGYIFGDGDAVHIESTSTGSSVNNSGRIEAGDVGVFVGLGAAFTAVIVNTGTIQGDRHSVEGNSGLVDLTNSGMIDGDIVLGGGADSIRNLGTILGKVNLGDGADIFDGRNGGPVSGAVLGGKGSDTLIGGSADDSFSGGQNDDSLSGKGGDDALTGGTGQDTMRGGGGADSFVFTSAADSANATPDTILDFSHADHDVIDLGAVFFGTLTFIGTAAFGTLILGEVRYTDGGTKGFKVEVDLNADAAADMTFIVHAVDATALVAGDFVL